MSVTKIFLVDDHKMVREGLKSFLQENPELDVIGEAENGQDCLDQLDSLSPDIILTDLNMPVMDGLDLTINLKKSFPDIKVITLTMMDESQHIKKMLAEGVVGYLLKNCSEEELLTAIKTIANGGTYYAPEVTNLIFNSIRKVKPTKKRMSVQHPLSDREKEVLHLILKEKANQEIADELFISVRTVDAHKRNLLDKTGSKTITGLVLYAIDNQLFDDI